jgi:hypothetical protein
MTVTVKNAENKANVGGMRNMQQWMIEIGGQF